MVYIIFMIRFSLYMESPNYALSYLNIMTQHTINIKIIMPKAQYSTMP